MKNLGQNHPKNKKESSQVSKLSFIYQKNKRSLTHLSMIFVLQWVFGFFTFMFPKASVPTRNKFIPWHLCGGRALLYMAICAALTGLLEKSTFLQLSPHQHESRLLNFTGLAILFFGIFVDLSVALGYYTLYWIIVWFLCFLSFNHLKLIWLLS